MTDIVRSTLDNGLRVVLAHDGYAERVAVSVHYGVGYRSEPRWGAGLAHLFEHLMFEGTAPGHAVQIHLTGGHSDARTHQDYTQYFQVVPRESLELVLALESARMRAPLFDERGLRRQLAGVAEEIRVTVHDRPYGGFPWPLLPPVLYRDWTNAHDGFGDPAELSRVSLAQCHEFFDTYYGPENAVLTIAGAIDVEQAIQLVLEHFADIPRRAAPLVRPLVEPPLDRPGHLVIASPLIGLPGLAVGYRLPDPVDQLPAYLAHRLLTSATDHFDGLAVHSDASCGFFGPLDALGPDTLIFVAVHDPRVAAERLLSELTENLLDLARNGLAENDFLRVRDEVLHEHHRDHADLLARCRALGRFELLFGDARVLDRVPGLISQLRTVDLATAAQAVVAQHHAVLQIRGSHAAAG